MNHPQIVQGTRWRALSVVAMVLIATLHGQSAHEPEPEIRTGGDARLVRIDPYPADEICLMPAAMQRASRVGEAHALGHAAGGSGEATTVLAGPPVRKVQDKYPGFAAIAVDPVRNEVVVTDENLFQILVYDRLENTPAEAEASRPKRVLAGDKTFIEFQSGVYVDPGNGDVYAPNNDTVDTLVVFGHGANGDVEPKRKLHTPHGTFGIAVDERRNELFLTTQHDSSVIVFRKGAAGEATPVRLLQGDDTGLADPHGVAIDPQKNVLYVANYGSRASRDMKLVPRAAGGSDAGRRMIDNWPVRREYAVPGSGSHSEPSISIHALTASGNTPPLGTIQGPNTQLNWPTGLAFHPERRELFVANDMGPSILVFDADARGNVAPKRVLKGPSTKLANPTSVALDLKNGELWVANFGGHSATAYGIDASGDAPPLRVIRSAPEDAPSLMIGNPGALTYDPKRQHILVPN